MSQKLIDKTYDDFHKRVQLLTGDSWCPYPSDMFMKVILSISGREAIQLIKGRRKFTFPYFLRGDPQTEELDKLNKKYKLKFKW